MKKSSSSSQSINLFEAAAEPAQNTLKRVIEALLFASGEPLSLNKIREVIETRYPATTPQKLKFLIESLREECIFQQRGYRLEESLEGYSFKTCEELAPFVSELYRSKRGEKLTQASLEVLAIVAYRQPITKPEIEAIRGVDCSGILQNLSERGLVEAKGKLEAPGRPTLFGTTVQFLRYFGLNRLEELPS